MKKLVPATVFPALLALSALSGHAETSPAPAAVPPMPRSSFSAPAEGSPAARNPFVPIGYVRPIAVAKEKVIAVTVTADQFTVTSYSIDPPPLAVINGRTYGVGEQIFVDAEKKEFVTVRQIRDGVVLLDHRGRTLECRSKPRGLK